MRGLIRRFDGFLRKAYGVYEFCDDPECLLRIRVIPAPHLLTLEAGQVAAGAAVIELHLWNEHIPPIPRAGPTLAWAIQFQRLIIASFRRLAAQMAHDPRLADVEAVIGVTVLISPGGDSGGEKLFRRLGFAVGPYHSPLGRFGEFWENFYSWGIMWAYNAVSLRQRRLLGLHRCEVWMSAPEFLRRYEA